LETLGVRDVGRPRRIGACDMDGPTIQGWPPHHVASSGRHAAVQARRSAYRPALGDPER
jgi:hypothetical protein